MSRGDRREEIFRDDLDRKSFLQALGAACEKTRWQCYPRAMMELLNRSKGLRDYGQLTT